MDGGTQIEDPFGEGDNDRPRDELRRAVRARDRRLGPVGAAESVQEPQEARSSRAHVSSPCMVDSSSLGFRAS